MKNKSKKIALILFMLVIGLIFFSSNTYAANENGAKVTSEIVQTSAEKNVLEAKLSIQMENMPEGTNAYTGKLKYDTEHLKLIEIKGLNGWNTPTHKDNNGEIKIAATNNVFSKENGEILVAKFEKTIEAEEYKITCENLEVATKIDGKITKVVAGEETKPKEIKQELTENKDESKTTVNVQNKKETTKEPFKPHIMYVTIIIIVVALVLLIGLGFYQKGKGGQKNENSK